MHDNDGKTGEEANAQQRRRNLTSQPKRTTQLLYLFYSLWPHFATDPRWFCMHHAPALAMFMFTSTFHPPHAQAWPTEVWKQERTRSQGHLNPLRMAVPA